MTLLKLRRPLRSALPESCWKSVLFPRHTRAVRPSSLPTCKQFHTVHKDPRSIKEINALLPCHSYSTSTLQSRAPGEQGTSDHFEPWTPPPVAQKAVAGLLDYAFRNGSFSWDYVVHASLVVLLQSLFLQEPTIREAPAAFIYRAQALRFHDISLFIRQNRLHATIDVSTNKYPRLLINLSEHTDPHLSSVDVVKLLYIHARRFGAIDSFPESNGKPVAWRCPESRVVPTKPYTASFNGRAPGKYGEITPWQVAATAAGIETPDPAWQNIRPFLESALPSHCALPDFSKLTPQLTSTPRQFMEELSTIKDVASGNQSKELRESWADMVSNYHTCPFGCGFHTVRIGTIRRHLLNCHYRTEEGKASAQARERELAQSRIIPCPHCESRFSQQHKLAKHINSIHQKYYPFRCPVPDCRREEPFTNILPWQNHFSLWHRWSPVGCPACGVTYSNRRSLSSHMRYIHPDITPEERAVLLDKACGPKELLPSSSDYSDKFDLKPVPPFVAIRDDGRPKFGNRSELSTKSTSAATTINDEQRVHFRDD